MTLIQVQFGAHEDVPPSPALRLPTGSSAICRCGAVFDHGNIPVPRAYAALCGRCAFRRGWRPRPYSLVELSR
jgi:hypothetical protein